MAVRRLYEPLCIAFGTTVSSPTVPTYQLYDLPHKFTPRLYMESEDPNLVLREIGVWGGWEQAGRVEARSFLLDLLKDKDAHDNFLLQLAGPKRFRSVSGIIVLTQKHLRIVQTRGSRLGGPRFQLTYQQACLVHGTKQGARGPRERFVYCHRTLTLEELERYLVPRYYASCLDAITRRPTIRHLPQCPPGAATLPKAVCPSDSLRLASPDIKAMEAELRPLAHPGSKCAPHALMMGLKIMGPNILGELEGLLRNCGDCIGDVLQACNNSRLVLTRNHRTTMDELSMLTNVLISDKQHCVFK